MAAHSRIRPALLPIVASVVAGVALLLHLGGPPLFEPDEARNAEIAREMAHSGSLLIPTLNGIPYLDKPALYFAAVAASLEAFGENEAAARLPSALFGLATLALVFLFCRRAYDGLTAALAVIVLSTVPLFLSFSRLVIFDTALTFFVSASIFAVFIAEEKEGSGWRRWYLAGAFAAASAILVKGPVGCLVPFLVCGAYLALSGRRSSLRRFFAPLNVAVVFGIPLAWFLAVVSRHPDFLEYGLLEETVYRFAKPTLDRAEPLYYFLPMLATGLFTWSFIMPQSAILALRNRSRWSPADLLLVVWSAVVLIFFSLSGTKRPGYILPALVALAPLLARVLARAHRNPSGRAARAILGGALALAVFFAGAALVWIALAARIDPLGRLLEQHPSLVAWLPDSAAGIAGSLLTCAVVAAAAARWFRSVPLAVAGFALLPLLAVVFHFDIIERGAGQRSCARLAEALRYLPAETEIICIDCYPEGLSFYLDRTVTVATDDWSPFKSNYIKRRFGKGAPRPATVLSHAQLAGYLAGRARAVYLVAREKRAAVAAALLRGRGMDLDDVAPGWKGALVPAPKGS